MKILEKLNPVQLKILKIVGITLGVFVVLGVLGGDNKNQTPNTAVNYPEQRQNNSNVQQPQNQETTNQENNPTNFELGEITLNNDIECRLGENYFHYTVTRASTINQDTFTFLSDDNPFCRFETNRVLCGGGNFSADNKGERAISVDFANFSDLDTEYNYVHDYQSSPINHSLYMVYYPPKPGEKLFRRKLQTTARFLTPNGTPPTDMSSNCEAFVQYDKDKQIFKGDFSCKNLWTYPNPLMGEKGAELYGQPEIGSADIIGDFCLPITY